MKNCKYLFMLFLVLACSFIFNIKAQAEDLTGKCGDNLTYTIKYNTNTYYYDLVISGKGDMYNYDEPQDAPWYGKRSSINAIYLADTLTSIGDNAFCDITKVNVIAIPQLCNTMSDTAFTGTTSAIKKIGKVYKNGTSSPSIVIGTCGSYSTHEKNIIYELNFETETLTLYGQGEGLMQDYSYTGTQYVPWYYDSNHIKKVIVKNGVKSIGDYAFCRYGSIENVIIEKGVQTIGAGAFGYCNNLKNVYIEDNSYNGSCSIEGYAFEDCTQLSEITIPDTVTQIGTGAFSGANKVVIKCNANSTAYKYAFENNININTTNCIHHGNYEAKTINDFIISGDFCKYCGTLVSDTVSIKRYIGSATNLEVPSKISGATVTAIGGANKYTGDTGAFSGCESLVNIVLPDTIQNIGQSAFSGCKNLENINLPENVTLSADFGGGIFYECESLKNLVIPDSVEVTEALLVGYSSNFHLNHITADPTREGYPWGAKQNHVWTKDFVIDQEAACLDGKKSKHCIYDGCTVTTEDTVIPATGKHKHVADENCNYFYDNTVKNGKRTYICPRCNKNITQYLVHITYDTGFAIDEQELYYCPDEEVKLSANTKEGYQFSNWSGYTNSQEKTITFKMPKQAINLTVNSTKIVVNNNPDNNPSNPTDNKPSVTEIKIGDTFVVNSLKYKLIKENAVSLIGSTNKNIKSLKVPTSVSYNGKNYKVVQIANKAFNKYSKLEKVIIGNNITEIGSESFANCKKLKSVTLGKKVSKIKTKAFYNCKNLKTIKISSSKLKSVGKKSITNINKKATIKAPAKKVNSYKKLFNSKTGYKKTMKIKK